MAKSKRDEAARQAILGPASAGVLQTDLEKRRFGQYEVVASIGRGGMGEIYLARTLGRDVRFVALKVLTEDVQGDEEILAMFMDEASIMARIDHPNVLRVFEFGQEDGRFFLAMEYLEGRPLVRVMIDAYGKLGGFDYGIVAVIGAGAARGLDAAHNAKSERGEPLNVIHRDVSPQNIFITYDGTPKVLDFGVARASERLARTSAGQLKGKAAYMSPEQIAGRKIDHRSDIFALGVCLWEMTAGRRLFRRGSDYETMAAVTDGPLVSPTELRGKADRRFDEIVLGTLQRDVSRRTSTGGRLDAELRSYASAAGVNNETLAALMRTLYAQEAEEEHRLMESIRSAAVDEASKQRLRALSGISPHGGVREITLAARSADLAELEDFGEESAPSFGDEAATISVDAIDDGRITKESIAIEDSADTPIGEDFSARTMLAMHPAPTPRAVAKEDETHLELAPVSADPAEKRVSKAVLALEQAAGGAAPPSSSFPPRSRSEGVMVELKDKAREPSSIGAPKKKAKMVALVAPRRQEMGVATIVGASALGLAVAVGIAYAISRGLEAGPDPPPPPVDAGAVSPDPLPPKPAAPSARQLQEQALGELERAGLPVKREGGSFTLPAAGGGAITLSPDVTFKRDEQGRGWLASSRGVGYVAVTWIHTPVGGPVRAIGLSINSCPVTASIQPLGIAIPYGSRQILLPPDGGPLKTLELHPPAFARRLEIKDLGIAFGEPQPARGFVECGDALADRFRVARIPPGRYSFSWLGGDRQEEFDVEIEEGDPELIDLAKLPAGKKGKKKGR